MSIERAFVASVAAPNLAIVLGIDPCQSPQGSRKIADRVAYLKYKDS